ncbi:MAG: COX15/CtaA family protein [Rubrivivax sp.]|nr:COX15/CtaA family protein [Rubrivivax sp.]
MDGDALVNYAPALKLGLLALLLAMIPLARVWLRQGAPIRQRLAQLTALTLFLTFDLMVFGSFTRLTDSGLGCPDWPGCYGQASPLGAASQIAAAEQAMPSGPVTWNKAWIEMIHRYLAMSVGVLILVMAAVSWLRRRELPHSPWWPTLTLLWVVIQGLFGRYTVTWKLYPAIVTAHLLGGLLLLALLAVQHERYRARPFALACGVRRLALVTLGILALQITLGGWVSTNYAVLACPDFPTCHAQWWPSMDFRNGFAPFRELGHRADGELLSFEALVAIHFVHRWFAVVAALALLVLGLRLRRQDLPEARRFGAGLIGLTLLQLLTGLSNIVLGWPLAAALVHAGGAAAMVLLLSLLLARCAPSRQAAVAPLKAPQQAVC